MSNTHRLIWFDQQINEERYPNRKSLAERFEISIRQAQRDIDYLKDSMGAPLEYDSKKRGYFYSDKAFILPNIYINEEQKKLLSFLAYSYENYFQTPKVKELTELFKKLSNNDEASDDVPVFDLNKSITENQSQIKNGIKDFRKMKLSYRDPHKGLLDVTIHPYKLFFKYRTDYIVCYCEDFDEIIAFRVDRIVKLQLLKETFKVNPQFVERKYSGFMPQEPYKARICYSKEPDLMDLAGFEVAKVEDNTYDIEFFEIDDLLNQLINMDYWESIISPNWLRVKLRERCEKIINRLDIHK